MPTAGDSRFDLADFGLFIRCNMMWVGALTACQVFLLVVVGLQNVPFADDANRRLHGISAWGGADGRWGSEAMARLMNLGLPLVDLGVTTFVLSALFLSIAGAMLVWALTGGRATWVTLLLALATTTNPWMLNALVFRFDGPFIAFSVLLAVSATLFHRARGPLFVITLAVITWATLNFFQISVALIFTVLLTRLVIDWLQLRITLTRVFARVGLAVVAIGLGGALYFSQVGSAGVNQSRIGFAVGSPLRALGANLRAFLIAYLQDNSPAWLVVSGLIAAFGVAALLVVSRRQPVASAAVVVGYLLLAVVASGGLLLLADRAHIAVHQRFRFPLAMGIGILGMVGTLAFARKGVGDTRFIRAMRVAFSATVVCFAYLWLSVTFIFAAALRDQHDALRLQVSIIFSDVFNVYRPGDLILYDPAIFLNTVQTDRLQHNFPIFDRYYLERIDAHSFAIRFRVAEMLGLGAESLIPTPDRPGYCELGPDAAAPEGATVLAGPRWQTWRADDDVICVTIPQVTTLVGEALPHSVVQIRLDGSWPFAAGGSTSPAHLLSRLELAIWSWNNPADIQWLRPAFYDDDDGAVVFEVPVPAAGWTGGSAVGHFFLDGTFRLQQAWHQ